MSTSTNNNKSPHYSYVERSPSGYVADYAELVCDFVSDLAYLPTSKSDIAIGSRCLCMEDGKTYVLNNAREWVEDLGATAEAGYPEPTGTLTITANDNYDVKDYAAVKVSVPASAVVSGSLSITQNGTYDVTEKAGAVVNVVSPTPFKGQHIYVANSSGSPINFYYIGEDKYTTSYLRNGEGISVPVSYRSYYDDGDTVYEFVVLCGFKSYAAGSFEITASTGSVETATDTTNGFITVFFAYRRSMLNFNPNQWKNDPTITISASSN